MNDADWMARAYQLALRAREQGEVPVGAVVVSEDNRCIGEGFNQVIQTHDPTAHAEIVALRAAAAHVQNYRLNQATLYVTLEPCCMCTGALIHARVARLVYATRDLTAGAAGSAFNFLQHRAFNHKVRLDEGVMQQESAALLVDFFKCRR